MAKRAKSRKRLAPPKAGAVTVASLVSGMLPNDASKTDEIASGIAGVFKPPINPNAPLTAEQAAKAEYMVLVAISRLVTQLLNNVGRAFNEEPNIPKTVNNERMRIAAALQSVALFFGKGGLDQPFADRFDQLASFIEDLNRGARSDLLTPPKGSGYRDSAETHKARAYLVFAIDALMKSRGKRLTTQRGVHRQKIPRRYKTDSRSAPTNLGTRFWTGKRRGYRTESFGSKTYSMNFAKKSTRCRTIS